MPENSDEENAQVRQLIDSAGLIFQAGILTKNEARHILEQIKKRTEEYSPDQKDFFAQKYQDHLNSLIDEFCVPDIE